ncbi:MAG: TonB-dependent receptor, partial [Betaproteobacteria bacterium]
TRNHLVFIGREGFSVRHYVVGVFHLNETANTARAAILGAAFGPAAGLSVTNSGTVKTDASALFASLDYDLVPALTLNLGARYTHETKNVLFNLGSAAPGLAGAFGVGTLDNYTHSRDENNLSPSIGATYALSKEQNLYAKFSRGYKSGGWNVDFISAAAGANPSFNTESVDTYEIGTKGQMLGGRLRYDLALYDSSFKNFQVFQFVNLGTTSVLQLTNAAAAQSKGLDGSLTWRATKQLDLGVNFGVVHATFSSFAGCTATRSCSGNHLPYAANFTSALTANYGVPVASLNGKLNFYGEYSYRGKSYSDPANDPVTQSLPSRELVNARVAFSPNDSHWDFNLWAHNVFGQDTVTARGQDFLGTYIVKRMEPRMVGIQAKYFFD